MTFLACACKYPDGFVIIYSVCNIGLSVFTQSVKYVNIIDRPGSECNSTIYCFGIN